MKQWVYLAFMLAFSVIIIGLILYVSQVHFQIDASDVPLNNTEIIGSPPSNTTVIIRDGDVMFAKVGLQNIPTIINGITTSTSIIVAFNGVVIAYMIRELFPTDRKAKIAFFGVFFAFVYVFLYLFWIYLFLATGVIDLALRWSLNGLLLSLLAFILTVLLGHYRLSDLTKKTKKKRLNSREEKGNHQMLNRINKIRKAKKIMKKR
jgi:hypothetical protein